MRRKDREITDFNAIMDIISDCCCCRLGFWDGEEVYIVPLTFGYVVEGERLTLYFHGAKEGRKHDLIEKSPHVGFEMDTDYLLKSGSTACTHTALYKSVIGTGRVAAVGDRAEKIVALRAIMSHTTGKPDWEFPDGGVDTVEAFKLVVDKLSCKCHE